MSINLTKNAVDSSYLGSKQKLKGVFNLKKKRKIKYIGQYLVNILEHKNMPNSHL